MQIHDHTSYGYYHYLLDKTTHSKSFCMSWEVPLHFLLKCEDFLEFMCKDIGWIIKTQC